jgi:alginate O-acetyltransferase complex protein AlgF
MNPKTSTLRALSLLALLGLTTFAANAGLYPPAAPPGSAFIRVFNGTNQARIPAQVGDKNLGDVSALDASAYVFLAPGSYPLKAGSASQNVTLQGAHCYTAAVENDGVHLFDQDCFNSQLKASVSLYNLLDGTFLSLKTADGNTAVVDGVAANAAGHREVNPVKVNLTVFNGASKVADAKPVALERGKAFSLFVTGSASEPMLIWITN